MPQVKPKAGRLPKKSNGNSKLPKKVNRTTTIDPETLQEVPVGAGISNPNFGSDLADKIADKLAGLSDLPPAARIEGARLAEAWIQEAHDFDTKYNTIAAELPFFMFPEKHTIVLGCMDRISMTPDIKIAPFMVDPFGGEWKTAKGTTRYWNEDKWLAKLKHGHQTNIYALAMHEGYFIIDPKTHPKFVERLAALYPGGFGKIIMPALNSKMLWRPGVQHPHLMVRAITKENPPKIWPSHGQEFIEFSNRQLTSVRNALAIKGAQIRTARLSGLVPWQLPGLHCENRFSHTMCAFYDKFCAPRKHPDASNSGALPGPTDPGLQALVAAENMMGIAIDDPRIVVITASAYESMSNCMEFYRLMGKHEFENYYQDALDNGAAFHAAVAVYYQEGMK